MSEFSTEPFFEIARRLEIRGETGWVAVLTPATDSSASLDQLQTELQSVLQKPARVIQLETSTFEELREALHQPDGDAVILSGGTGLTLEKWRSLDIMRSALERKGPVILWLSPGDVAHLIEHAPNIRSFIGGSIFLAGPDRGIMTETERQERLKELSQHFGFSGAEAVRKAQAGELPHEPEFVEWLVLLGRGDLL
ncbi:MAG: hypothetical protein ABSF71_03855 [Terriglobia bacterium]